MTKKFYWYVIAFVLACIFLAGGVHSVAAAPAAPIDHTLTQPDSSTFLARQWGDEWRNGFMTLQGNLILKDEDGWWVYARLGLDGKPQPALVSGRRLLVGIDLPLNLPPITGHLSASQLPTEITSGGSLQVENAGTQPVLVLLASFSDRAGIYQPADFQSAIFGAANSVRDFYLKASFNKLTLAPAAETNGAANDGVVGWLNLGYKHPNTGDYTSSLNKTITWNALVAANSYVDYASYDTNGDGYISTHELHIIVVVAGYERSYDGVSSPSIWAHQWTLDGITTTTLDGKYIGKDAYGGGYTQFGEIHGDHPATIGIMAHEFGHDLSWPDLYDVDNSSNGVGNWSIMGTGSWTYTVGNYPGSSPALPDAWLKWYQGWITPSSVYGTVSGLALPQAETSPAAILLRPNPNGVDWEFEEHTGTGEYFLVENRQKSGYDAGLPGCGLLIWHIDESVTYTNSANANDSRPLLKLMQADGLDELRYKIDRGDAGDPYPGTTNNTIFNYSSNPSSRLYSGADSLVSVTEISTTCAPSMTATFTYAADIPTYQTYLPMVRYGGLEVLWEQKLSVVETGWLADQDFESAYDTFDIFLADDFVVGESNWLIEEIFVPGTLNDSGTSLANASQLVFQIYADEGGKPAGSPASGGALWNLALTPSDPQMLLSSGIDGFLSNVRLKLNVPFTLLPGRYWLVFYPKLDYATNGQYGRHVSDTLNGYDALVINPLGGFGFPTVWTSIRDLSTWALPQQDLAFKLSGYR